MPADETVLSTIDDVQVRVRNEDAARLLAWWEHHMRLPIVLSALLPLLLIPGDDRSPGSTAILFVTWLVFLADLVVRVRCIPGYLHTLLGRVDLAIVVLTFPWSVIGLGSARFSALLRLGRLARLVVLGHGLKRMVRRLTRVAWVAVVLWVTCSWIVYRAERPDNGFTSMGDSLWWGIVTLTTVGYGDLIPQTVTGRVTAGFLMVSGVVLLGALAGTLSSTFTALHRADVDGAGPPDDGDGDAPAGAANGAGGTLGSPVGLTAGATVSGHDAALLHDRLDRLQERLDAVVTHLERSAHDARTTAGEPHHHGGPPSDPPS